MEVVIVPAWRRPDFLYATMRRLLAADPGDVLFWLYLDRGADPVVEQVAKGFAAGNTRVRVARRGQHPYRGNSYNVLAAYAEALAAGAELVHLVEEDVFVGVDYFRFHRRAHQVCPQAFAVSAVRNHNLPPDCVPAADDTAVYAHRSYQSLGVSWRPAMLRQVVAHACPDYYGNPVGYCAGRWPASAIPAGNAEQDGLCNRIGEAGGWPTVYPAAPRAYHAGFWGYNRRGRRLTGDVAGCAARLLAMGAAELNAMARSYPDHTVVDLDAPRGDVTRQVVWP